MTGTLGQATGFLLTQSLAACLQCVKAEIVKLEGIEYFVQNADLLWVEKLSHPKLISLELSRW